MLSYRENGDQDSTEQTAYKQNCFQNLGRDERAAPRPLSHWPRGVDASLTRLLAVALDHTAGAQPWPSTRAVHRQANISGSDGHEDCVVGDNQGWEPFCPENSQALISESNWTLRGKTQQMAT